MKAQFYSIDVVFAIIVFMAAIILLLESWTTISQQFSLTFGSGTGNMQAQLLNLQQRVIGTGSPQNWNTQVIPTNTNTWTNVSIGLGTGNNVTVSTAKILSLMQMARNNYTATKPLLGIGYEYYIVISSPDFYNVSIGINPSKLNATSVQVASRQVSLDSGVPANIKMMVWTNQSFGIS